MTTWMNSGSPYTIEDGSGATWNNAAPVYNYQPQPTYQQYDVAPSYQQPSYSYGNYGNATPWQQQNAYTMGRGGYTGDGMISQRDYAHAMGGLMQDKYNSGYAAMQRGDQNAPGWYQLQELKAAADRFKTTEANNGYTGQMFARPQFEVPWYEFNAAAQQWGGQRGNVEQYLPNSLRGQNTGEQWRGFYSTPTGTSFGSGADFGDYMGGGLPQGLVQSSFSRGSSFDGGGYQPLFAQQHDPGMRMPTAYNNGDGRSAHDYGSYLTPLLRSGHDDHFAVASIHPNSIGMGGGQTDGLENMNPRWFDPAAAALSPSTSLPITQPPSDGLVHHSRPDGGYWTDDGRVLTDYDKYGRVQSRAGAADTEPQSSKDRLIEQSRSRYSPEELLQQPGYVAGGTWLPWQLAESAVEALPMPVQTAIRGFDIVNAGNPAQILPRNIALGIASQGLDKAAQGIRHPDSLYSQMSNVLSQPWANRSLPFASYPSALGLFL